MRTSPHKHRVSAVLARRFPLEFCTRVFFMFCVLRLADTGFAVQCSHLGSLWNFARVCFLCFACFASQTPGLPCSARTSVPFGILHACVYVSRASPRKHRVCAVLFPRLLLSLYACVCHVLPHKHQVCAVLFSRFPFKKFVRLCFARFVMRIFPHKHLVCAVPFPRPPVKLIFVVLCYAYFASRAPASCSAFLSAPLKVYTLILVVFCQSGQICFCIS